MRWRWLELIVSWKIVVTSVEILGKSALIGSKLKIKWQILSRQMADSAVAARARKVRPAFLLKLSCSIIRSEMDTHFADKLSSLRKHPITSALAKTKREFILVAGISKFLNPTSLITLAKWLANMRHNVKRRLLKGNPLWEKGVIDVGPYSTPKPGMTNRCIEPLL